MRYDIIECLRTGLALLRGIWVTGESSTYSGNRAADIAAISSFNTRLWPSTTGWHQEYRMYQKTYKERKQRNSERGEEETCSS